MVKKNDGLYKSNVREESGCYKIKAEVRLNAIIHSKVYLISVIRLLYDIFLIATSFHRISQKYVEPGFFLISRTKMDVCACA